MERRHQVFVSSTYEDLRLERQEVIHALLELDCIPAGMELFPAADEDSWSLIQGVIDDSDYYIAIVAGRYGSVDQDGVSYTEKEYDYALSIGKPTLVFLHEDLGKIRFEMTEKTDGGKERLSAFREKLKKAKQCKMWCNPSDLGGKVSRSLIQLRKRHPSPGWVPGRYAADEKLLHDMETLRNRVLELEATSDIVTAPPGTETLAQGSDKIALIVGVKVGDKKKEKQFKCSVSWDDIFRYVGPSLMGECNETLLEERIRLAYFHELTTNPEAKDASFEEVIVPYVLFDKIKVQLEALGLIAPGVRKRAVSDTGIYWKLTAYGRRYLVKLRALRRQADPHVLQADSAVRTELESAG